MSNANWWAQKVGGGSANGQSAPRNSPSRPAPAQVVSPVESTPPVRARSAKSTECCPDCYSGNYMQPAPTAGWRCFDCGYPIVQSGSGMSGVKSDGPVRPARQPAGTQNNFNPTVIVGRIG